MNTNGKAEYYIIEGNVQQQALQQLQHSIVLTPTMKAWTLRQLLADFAIHSQVLNTRTVEAE